MINRILHLLARFLPGATNLRPFLHRQRGVKIYGNVFIGDDVYIENEYPECIEIHEGAQIALRCTIVAHTRGVGKIIIGKNAFIAVGCTIVCAPGKSLTIGEGSVVSAGSIVQRDIPRNTFCGSPRIKAIATLTAPFTLNTSYEDFVRGLRPLRRR